MGKVFSPVTDLFLGKKDPGTPDKIVDPADPTARWHQGKALDSYGQMLNKDMGQMSRTQTAQMENQARAGADDQERIARQMVAQRGLGNSSVGLNAVLNQKAGLSEKLGDIRANQPLLEHQMNQQNLQFASGGINSILNEQGQSKVFQQGQASQGRQGGLMPLLGAGAGAYLGGAQGAKVGLAMGQAATQIG
jgi:hypothetical protein